MIKTKEDMSKLKYSAGNVVATNDEISPGRGTLHLMVSVFLVSVQKTPGTKVTYSID